MNQVKFTNFPALDYPCQEAIHTLCTNLSFVGANKRIMMTSCQAHEGKSFLSMCILRNMAALGHSVVLVDVDLRRSQIASRYGMEVVEGEGMGVSHYLADMCSLDDVIYESDVPGAHYIPVGHKVSNSLTLLNSPRFEEMLKVLQARFKYVLVDAPPVGVIIDAAEVARFCDGTIFVVKDNHTSRRALAEARAQIERAGCDVLGAVLNEVAFDSLSSKKYYNKNYYARYESEYYTPDEK